jgi:phenylacetate-CoA ligase
MLLHTLLDLVWLERCEHLSRERLERLQTRELRAIVAHAAKNVPFYAKLYESFELDSSEIRSLSDLGKLPIVSKQQFRDTPLTERTAIGTDVKSCRTRTTSGSTGIPITVLVEPSAMARRVALWLRRFRAYGIGLRDKVCVVIPGEHRKSYFSSPSGLTGLVMRSRIRTLSLAAGIRENADLISKWKPTVIVGPASYHRALIRFLEETGRDVGVRVVIANGEMLDGRTRKQMAEKYHTDSVFETWGAGEVGPIAWECPTHSGYHINAESIIVEFLRDGLPVARGEPGELCVTNLYRKATPTVRYLLGDVATSVDEDCSCGRGLPLMKENLGRLVDYVTTRDGTLVSPYRVIQVLEDVDGVAQYKVIQDSEGHIEVQAAVNANGVSPEQTLKQLEQNCRQLFGDTSVTVRQVTSVDASGKGKSRLVESHFAR